MKNFAILKGIYNGFDPFRPLPAGDPAYVDCREVRGDGDILTELGTEILFCDRKTCQLYAGHRGAGKSTELLRFRKYLEEQNCFVVYFQADEEDIDPEDAQYTDILLACTRHLIEELKETDPKPLLNWLENRWQEMRDLALTQVSLEKLSFGAKIAQFANLTANLRAVPSERQKIRQLVNPHTTTLIAALNQFIENAKNKLPLGREQLVVIADNLDRIVPVIQEDGRTNHDHIFLDRCEQLKALSCNLVYTVPISMLYSHRASDLRDNYGDAQILPMIMVRMPDGVVLEAGLAKLKEIIAKRVNPIVGDRNLETEIFDSKETLEQLCLMSGGHVRELCLLMRGAVKRTNSLPITAKAVQRSITEARDVYRRTVNQEQWSILAEVSLSKQLANDDRYRSLLFTRCLLEYVYFDEQGEMKRWCDVHPLIRGIKEFQYALEEKS